MTLSGEIRFRPEGFRVRATDTAPATRDQYLLQRYLFGTDVHFGRRLRLYAEVQSGIINGRIGTSRPTDENTVDVHQAFLEWRSAPDAARRFDVRVGRLEADDRQQPAHFRGSRAQRQAQLRWHAARGLQPIVAVRGRGRHAHRGAAGRLRRRAGRPDQVLGRGWRQADAMAERIVDGLLPRSPEQGHPVRAGPRGGSAPHDRCRVARQQPRARLQLRRHLADRLVQRQRGARVGRLDRDRRPAAYGTLAPAVRRTRQRGVGRWRPGRPVAAVVQPAVSGRELRRPHRAVRRDEHDRPDAVRVDCPAANPRPGLRAPIGTGGRQPATASTTRRCRCWHGPRLGAAGTSGRRQGSWSSGRRRATSRSPARSSASCRDPSSTPPSSETERDCNSATAAYRF